MGDKGAPMVPVRIGQRIAGLRQQHGWTQESIGERLGISRVAVSHIEADISFPSERTLALFAGLFKMSPHDLVAGTTYPKAKADRLPAFVCSFTHLEMDLLLLEKDLAWLERLEGHPEIASLKHDIRESWLPVLEEWGEKVFDQQQRTKLDSAKLNLLGL
jgi:transcriptional regulator with XRE-family HTH domain